MQRTTAVAVPGWDAQGEEVRQQAPVGFAVTGLTQRHQIARMIGLRMQRQPGASKQGAGAPVMHHERARPRTLDAVAGLTGVAIALFHVAAQTDPGLGPVEGGWAGLGGTTDTHRTSSGGV